MKYLFLFFFIVLYSTLVISQNKLFNKHSIDFSLGLNKPFYPISSNFIQPNALNPTSAGIGYRFMTNDLFGIKASFTYNRFKFKSIDSSGSYFSHYYRTSLEGVINLLGVLDIKNNPDKFGILLHGGGGFSILQNDLTLKKIEWKNDHSDIMINFVVGVNSHYKLSKRLAINLDFSFIPHLSQTFAWDMYSSAKRPGFDGIIIDISTGLFCYLGKNDDHFDWKRKTF